MKILITGGCGFLGSNLASEVIKRGDQLVIFDNISRLGSEKNLLWLKGLGNLKFIHGDIRNYNDVSSLIKSEEPDVVFHLAGQVAMTTSISNPLKDFEINSQGSLNLLESVRKHSSHSVVVYSSTNKVYGDLEWLDYDEMERRYICKDFINGFPENIPLNFSSPYGCSKGSADQYMLDYFKIFGVKTVVFRHSSMYGGRQFSTYDQGWIGWFCDCAVKTKKGLLSEGFSISGDGKQVRDLLHADDMIKLYFSVIDNIEAIAGQVFNIGGGANNSLSILELFEILEEKLDIKLNYFKIPARKSDQKVFIADISKAQKLINWSPSVSKDNGIEMMLEWVGRQNYE